MLTVNENVYRRRVFMKRKLCLALSAVMLAGSLSGCSGGTSGLPGDTSKASEAPAGKEAEGTKGGIGRRGGR